MLFVIVLTIGGVLVWNFVTWDESINVKLDSVPIPDSGGGGRYESGDDSVGESDVSIISYDDAFAENSVDDKYKFIQCDSNGTACCNGLDSICDLRANEILYATLHNGMSTIEDGFLFGPNHKFQLEKALKAGYRGLNLDICNCGGEIIFCHGICTLGPRDVSDVMNGVNTFLDQNPSEIIVFIYQVNNDVDRYVDLNDFYDKLLQIEGLTEKMYVHDGPTSSWPTLRQLTDPNYNKRVIMFHYNGPDCNEDRSRCPDGLHLYYNYAIDNDWSHDDTTSIENRLSSCRLKSNGINRDTFIGLNNFVSPPSRSSAETLNEYSAASEYVETCTALLKTDINFLLVDFWSVGEVPRVTQDHNRALASQRRTRERSFRW